ncbi:tetratricopeptide repeat protein [Paractinoplanes brasiliensis]|uniref:Tetratricopeptide repeat protein n=1 Tax=Paractinoplanes brasiliensis TaxID=52695 RepID=A0A4R6JKH0_9ACTN|nr:tetratricopeptide repeat protein [Actinoplanes brasiliensis]TDO36773.1 tetratricopeptide repeat protein [Actinoplanes brasiliensis]GID30290.1 hypothetical protein Abr02nite_52730 [Actinoplanes brasiliensis]
MSNEIDGNESARAAYHLGLALLEGRVTAGPDDPFEAGCGALRSAIAAGDAEWSPRAAYMLGMALFGRDDLAGARSSFTVAQRSGHPEWSVGGLIGQAHLAAREHRPHDAATLFRQVIEAGQDRFTGSAWYNLGTIHQQEQLFAEAVQAYRQAMASGDLVFAPKAANNLGFVLANHLDDPAGARQAFRTAVASGDLQQVQLAEQNLRAMDELDRRRRAGTPLVSGEDDVDLSVPHEGGIKRRWWFPKRGD